jgi:hypothetical protein
MHMKELVILALAGAVVAGCAANDLKARKDDGWSPVSQTLPDGKYIYNPSLPTLSTLPDPTWVGSESTPNAYGHLFRLPALVFHPIGVALDYALIRPLHMLGGLAPEWFGLTTDDALGYQSHMPELMISKDAPRYRHE